MDLSGKNLKITLTNMFKNITEKKIENFIRDVQSIKKKVNEHFRLKIQYVKLK